MLIVVAPLTVDADTGAVPDIERIPVLAIVIADEPLNDVPDKPVPIVNAFVVVAVTVVDPPKLTELPLIVTALFESELLPILDNVFVSPLIVLFVKI